MSTDPTYLLPQLTADEAAIHQQTAARLSELLPGWQDRDTAIESLVSRARAAQDAVWVDLAVDVFATIAAQVGETAGVVRQDPLPAKGRASIVTDGEATYVLQAGATMVAYTPDGTQVTFATGEDITIPDGTTTVSDIEIEATEPGLVEGLNPQELEPDQAFAWLVSVDLTSVEAFGADGDTDEEFLDRVARRLVLLADRPILPEDFQALALEHPGVGRAVAINLLDATDPAEPVPDTERCVTVVITGPNGSAPAGGLLTQVDQDLQSRREVNFKVFVVPPTYVPVTVEVTVAVWPEYLDIAEDLVAQEIEAWLSPASWGGREAHGSDSPRWTQTSTLRIGEVVSVADRVAGVDYVPPSLVKIGVNGGAATNSDKTLTAPIAALPDPDNTTVTVHVVEREP